MSKRIAVERSLPGGETAAPWGQKITVSIYLEGNEPSHAERVLSAVQDMPLPRETTFVGARVEPVQDEPKDQAGS